MENICNVGNMEIRKPQSMDEQENRQMAID